MTSIEKPEARQPIRRNQYIYDVLRANILERRVQPGLVLTESALSKLFGVSRAPTADALSRLADEGLIVRHDGRGFLVGAGGSPRLRVALEDSGLAIPPTSAENIAVRGWRDALYPTVESEIAGCISYGTFGVAGAAMAKHYSVSRTTTQEMLGRLERVGLVEQGTNGRWIAPRLTVKGARDHYQMRRLLEPVALLDAVRRLGQGPVAAARARIAELRTRAAWPTVDDITAVEGDLHRALVHGCSNEPMRATITRSQLPLIATHMAFSRYLQTEEMARVLDDHDAVLFSLQLGKDEVAASQLRDHLDQGLKTTVRYLEGNPDPPPGLIPPYMTKVD